MNETITTKELASSIGKPVRTVQDWIKKLSAKSALVSAISASSSPMNPSRWTLAEACRIIEEGLGADVANTFRTNAANAEVTKVTRNVTNGKLPAGIQIRAMAELYGSEEARRRIDFVLGYKADQTVPVYPYRIESSKSVVRLSKAAYAVEMKEQQKARDKAWQEAHEGKLF